MPSGATLAYPEEIIGKPVQGANGQEIGQVADVTLSPRTDEPEKLIIRTGGQSGDGKLVAVDFTDAQLRPEQGVVVVSELTASEVGSMQAFEYGSDTVSLTRMTDSESR